VESKKTGKESIKHRFTSLIEQMILSGELAIGQKLPPEREISDNKGISRTIVHAGLIELAAKQVLTIVPRKGTYVNDYKKEGSLEIYNALTKYSGLMDEGLFQGLLEYREIVEIGNARLAAKNRTPQDIELLYGMLERERGAKTVDEAAEADYLMHLQIAMATKNIILPMAIRSIEMMYKSLDKKFYSCLDDREVVYNFHDGLITAIQRGDAEGTQRIMKTMLDHGKTVLEGCFKKLYSEKSVTHD
jgi:GntR family transcriptional repressor for pyruvate dehydrogenase complex